MQPQRPSLEDELFVILERLDGIPYMKALKMHDMTPAQFYKAVTEDIGKLVRICIPERRHEVEKVKNDESVRSELFYMSPALIKYQVERVCKDPKQKFYPGTLKHPKNWRSVIYYAFVHHYPVLGSEDRKEILNEFKTIILPMSYSNPGFNRRLAGLLYGTLGQNAKSAFVNYDAEFVRRTGQEFLSWGKEGIRF